MAIHHVVGNYELNAVITGTAASPSAEIVCAGDPQRSIYAYLAVTEDTLKIVRTHDGQTSVWKTSPGIGPPPWRIRILKKGNFFRFRVNAVTTWIRGPLGEWEGIYEPRENVVSVRPKNAAIESCTITTLSWLDQITEPVIRRGPPGSFYEEQVIPGAILDFDGRYYMYCMAGMKGTQEGAARRTIGVAWSDDLRTWTMHPEPVLSYADLPGDNLYVSGAVTTPDGRIAVMFSAQRFPEWLGFMLAVANHPLGPFTPYKGNPVYKHVSHAHEFDLVRVDHPDYRYLLFYAGFTSDPTDGGPAGDRGYMVYSDDLIHWTPDAQNPVFGPETTDDWDAIHVRPRSLNRIGEMWYLWYEGCNAWTPPGLNGMRFWDTVGLARSPDLRRWTYYPRNPALPALGISSDQFDSNWTGWPRMVIRDGVGYVFYTGNAQVGLRTIPVDRLTDWENVLHRGGFALEYMVRCG